MRRSTFLATICALVLAALCSAGGPAIEMLEISPSPYTTIEPGIDLHARLRFNTGDPNTHAGVYCVRLLFATTEVGRFIYPSPPVPADAATSEPPTDLPGLAEISDPEGEVAVEYPINAARRLREVAVPLRLHFALLRREEGGRTTVVATSDEVQYPVSSAW